MPSHQEAMRAEVHRQDLLKAADAYIADLVAEVGEPTREQTVRAEAIARRIRVQHVKITPGTLIT